MTQNATALVGAEVFDGMRLLPDHAVMMSADRISAILPQGELPEDVTRISLAGGRLLPGFVDLQVNGGGGVMFNDAQTVDTLRTMAQAHASLGTTSLLPTLITDTPERTRAAIDATRDAIAAGVAGIAGLHLEGPHLSLPRKGAHDPSLIRPMEASDLDLLLEATRDLPALIVTIAPENVTLEQIAALRAAGATVSLGHTDTDLATCVAAAEAGATCVTHLYNAMRQLGHREPGVVGAALSQGGLSAGLIADLIHVHPVAIGIAMRAKAGPGRIFLITDAMATAGAPIDSFVLNGRRIERRDGRLTLSDGTLAGADLDLATALRNMMGPVGLPAADALAMATSVPAGVVGLEDTCGHLAPGHRADLVHLSADGHLAGVWQGGVRLEG